VRAAQKEETLPTLITKRSQTLKAMLGVLCVEATRNIQEISLEILVRMLALRCMGSTAKMHHASPILPSLPQGMC